MYLIRPVLSVAQKAAVKLFDDDKALVSGDDTRWIDGLRGIASIFVVCSHLTISFRPELVFTPNAEAAISFWHWPIIRTFAEGFPWVAIFLVLSGFVNALKPIKLMRNDQRNEAWSALATSCFKRSLRLVLPCTLTTFLAWIMAQAGAFKVGKAVNSQWLSSTSPSPSDTWLRAVGDLFWAIWSTWVGANNYYDQNQWTMAWFLRGSMALYVILLATSNATPTGRMAIVFMMFVINWKFHDDMVGIPTYGGVLFAELSMLEPIRSFAKLHTNFSRAVAITLFLIGSFLLSFPNIHPEWAPWFNMVVKFGQSWYPEGSNQFSMTLYIGFFLILLSVLLSSSFQKLLSLPVFLWLGKISFPMYLLHGPLLRSFLCWIMYLGQYPRFVDQAQSDGSMARVPANLDLPSNANLAFTIPIFFAVVLFLSHQWTERVEPILGNITKLADDLVTGKGSITIFAFQLARSNQF